MKMIKMKSLFGAFCLLAAVICAGADSEPCDRVSEIIGEAIELIRNDYYISQVTNGRASRDLDFVKEEILSMIGVDFTDPRERQEFICRAFGVKKLSEVYDFIMNETPAAQYGLTYDLVCMEYKGLLRHYEVGHMAELSLDNVDLIFNVTKDLVLWMQYSGFPDRFPIRGNHKDNVKALEKIGNFFDDPLPNEYPRRQKYYMLKELVTGLLPIWPLRGWEIEQNKTRITAEDVVTWMEESTSGFQYAEKVRKNAVQWLDIQSAKRDIDILEFEKVHYNKVLWYKEALGYVLKTNLLNLDISDCPATSGQENEIPNY